jgi:hypothetical protein
MGAEFLYDAYKKAGINFSKNIITNYCLSLYTKPFVILSGISGTGKTKIAQLFQPYIEEEPKEYDVSKKKNIGKEYITLTLTDGIINGDGRGNFKKEDLPLLLSPEEFEAYKNERDKLLEKGTADNFKQLYEMTLIDGDNAKYGIQFYVQRAQSPLIRARFKSKRGAANEYDLQPYMKKKYNVGDVIQLEKIEEKQFRIVKSEDEEIISLERSAKIKTYEDNVCLIPVKSDWTDPSGIMGFYNIIEKQYHIGPFLKHLLFAIENPDVPFFVILDEMNLSKIEYYLSDVLSVLETRLPHTTTGEIITKEKIMLHSASASDDYIATDDEYFDSIPAKVNIPLNFYITGTINIDETTYTPSPKVLDRANVIEFSEVDLENYFNDVETEDKSTFVLHTVPDFTKPVVASPKVSAALPATVKNEIISINNILKKYNLHFGYRIASEISLYVFHVLKYVANPTGDILNIALDYQITQKILPKISGTQARIEKAIMELFNSFTGVGIDLENIDLSIVASHDSNTSRYPNAVRKLKNIHTKLTAYGFASSIE